MIKVLDKALDKMVKWFHPDETCATFDNGKVVWDHDVVHYLKVNKRLHWYDRFRIQKIVTEAAVAFAELVQPEEHDGDRSIPGGTRMY